MRSLACCSVIVVPRATSSKSVDAGPTTDWYAIRDTCICDRTTIAPATITANPAAMSPTRIQRSGTVHHSSAITAALIRALMRCSNAAHHEASEGAA